MSTTTTTTATATGNTQPARLGHSIKDLAFQASVIAGMNQRYHQHEARTWWWWDAIAKIVTAVFAVIGAALSIVTARQSPDWVIWLSIAISILAAIGAFVLNVIPLGNWNSKHLELLARWSDLREDADALEFDIRGGDGTASEFAERLKQIESRRHRLCAAESLARAGLWRKCEIAERRMRGLPINGSIPTPPLWSRAWSYVFGGLQS